MSFEHAKDARVYAQLETVRTHYVHQVVSCKKYLCPPKEYFGKDHIYGFTVVLTHKKAN